MLRLMGHNPLKHLSLLRRGLTHLFFSGLLFSRCLCHDLLKHLFFGAQLGGSRIWHLLGSLLGALRRHLGHLRLLLVITASCLCHLGKILLIHRPLLNGRFRSHLGHRCYTLWDSLCRTLGLLRSLGWLLRSSWVWCPCRLHGTSTDSKLQLWFRLSHRSLFQSLERRLWFGGSFLRGGR